MPSIDAGALTHARCSCCFHSLEREVTLASFRGAQLTVSSCPQMTTFLISRVLLSPPLSRHFFLSTPMPAAGCTPPPPPLAVARPRSTLPHQKTSQKQEELQFAVGAAVADLACSGPLRVPAGKLLEDMRTSALAARRETTEEQGVGGAAMDALDYVLYQVGDDKFRGLLYYALC